MTYILKTILNNEFQNCFKEQISLNFPSGQKKKSLNFPQLMCSE